jgi:hypothetical protein
MPWTTQESWFDSRQRQEIFLFSIMSKPDLRPTQPPIQWASGAASPRVKRQEREADHSPPSSAKVERYLHSPIRLHSLVLTYLGPGLTLPFFHFFSMLTVQYIQLLPNQSWCFVIPMFVTNIFDHERPLKEGTFFIKSVSAFNMV